MPRGVLLAALAVAKPSQGSAMAIRRCLVALLGLIAVWCGAAAHALINPHFTPVHLVKQAALILTVELRPGAAKDQYTATVQEVLKGQLEGKTLRLDLAKAINPQNAAALRELAALGKPALFFVGEFGDAAEAKGGSVPDRRALLHISGQWAEFYGAPDGAWSFNRFDAPMQGVWAGGTDMLRRAVHYILHDDDPDVPVIDGASWDANQRKIATFDGKLRAVRTIDLAGDGRLVLFVARDQGDRLLIGNPKSRDFTDATASRRLASRSQAFAWADFNADGRLDLVSFDGRTLSLHAQQADGTFQAKSLALDGVLERGCVGLATVPSGKPVMTGLMISTNSCPVLVTWDADGKCSSSDFVANGVEWQKLGPAGCCLVADFDGDGHPDVLQPYAAGSLLFRGLGSGKFASATACAVRLGSGPSHACLGDFDGDGRLDVLAVAADAIRIWQNEGAGVFTETLHLSGEIAYIGKPGGIDCAVGDINNDGRQDALIAYASLSPQIFFNRGTVASVMRVRWTSPSGNC